MDVFDVFAHRSVDGFAVAYVGDVDHDFDEMLHGAASFLNELFDVLHHFVGLLDRIVAVDVGCIIKVLRALPA